MGPGHILGPIGSSDHPFVPVNLESYIQFGIFLLKTTRMRNTKHFLKGLTFNLFQ